jgi:hypothetical protein
MAEHGEQEPEPDDAEERRKRAERLHEEIERLKSGEPDEPGQPLSPREFTEPGRRHEPDSGDSEKTNSQ